MEPINPRPSTVSSSTRAIAIGWAFLLFALGLGLRRLRPRMPGPVPAERFTAMLQGLGVTFVKLGQHLSLRPDLLPPAYIASLEQLQDHVKPFPAQQAQFEIENALGAPVTRLFARFDPAPLAAASMAQIHVAVLHDGRKVAVKVRRPGIVDQIEQDMRLLRVVARVAQRFVPALAVHRPVEIVDEIRANLRLELDFHREACSVRQFARAFDGSATVAIPDMVDGLCAENVFVQIFSGGRRIDSLVDHAKSAALAQAIIDAYLLQFFTLGVFHGDPHPGNLFVMDDGRVCFHDFGIVGYLERRTRRALAAFAAGFMAQDADWVLDAWLEMGVIGAREQRSAFERAVGELVREYAQRPRGNGRSLRRSAALSRPGAQAPCACRVTCWFFRAPCSCSSRRCAASRRTSRSSRHCPSMPKRPCRRPRARLPWQRRACSTNWPPRPRNCRRCSRTRCVAFGTATSRLL